MTTPTRIIALAAAAAVSLSLASLATAGHAEAFEVGRSQDFPTCNIWYNSQGKPLRNKFGREIAQEVPCPGQQGGRERYKAYAGAMANTLVIRDETHHAECALALAPGSTTVMVQTVCQELAR